MKNWFVDIRTISMCKAFPICEQRQQHQLPWNSQEKSQQQRKNSNSKKTPPNQTACSWRNIHRLDLLTWQWKHGVGSKTTAAYLSKWFKWQHILYISIYISILCFLNFETGQSLTVALSHRPNRPNSSYSARCPPEKRALRKPAMRQSLNPQLVKHELSMPSVASTSASLLCLPCASYISFNAFVIFQVSFAAMIWDT